MRAPARLICPSCHSVSPRGMRFCGRCGASLADAAPALGRTAPKSKLGERRLLTVMFCDLVGSTRLGSRLEPEDLRNVLLTFREACASAIGRCGGTIGQYLGDGILAYFGYPRAREDDARRALRAALHAREAMAGVNAELARSGVRLPHPLEIRIGVHSGLVVVGDLGKGRNAETAAIVGDTTNIAARLQAAASSGTILASEAVASLAGDRFALLDAGLRELAGIEQPLQTFTVLGEAPRRAALSPKPKPGAAPFLDRHSERAALRAAWAAAAEGNGTCIVVEAEPGMGKTRLICEFRDKLGRAGRSAAMLACAAEDRSSAYQPLLSWIRAESSLPDGGSPAACRIQLRKALGFVSAPRHELHLAALLDCATPEEQRELADTPRRRRRETVDALLAFVTARLRGPGPHLMVVEDLHWADDSTLTFIRALAERCASGWNLLLLLTTRLEGSARRDFAASVLRLERLPERDARALVRAVAPSGMAQDVVEGIVRRTDGIPLFAEEVARLAAAAEGAASSYARWSGKDIPLTLRSTLAAQLDALGPAKPVAQLASVIGRSFQREVLEAVADGTEQAKLASALARLVEARFLEQQAQGTGTAVYVFRHALIRDAAYDSILRDRRRELHLRIGTVLRDEFPAIGQSRPEILAQHFALAGSPLEAADFYEQAARRAASRSTHTEAAQHCDAALAQLRELAPTADTTQREIRLHILLAAQITAVRGNGNPAVRASFERAREVAETTGDQKSLRRALRGLHTFHLVRGDVTAGFEISRRVLELAGDERNPGERIQLHRPHGLTLLYMGRFEEARRELLAAASLYDPRAHAGHRFEYGSDPLTLSRSHLGWVEWFLGDPERAAVECEAAVEVARGLRHPHSLAFALAFQSCLGEFTGAAESARACAEELVHVAEQHDYAYWSAWGRIISGWAHASGGKPERGEALLRRGLAEYEATGGGLLVPYANMLLAGIVGPRDPELAARLRRDAQTKAERGGMGVWKAWAARRLQGNADEPGEATVSTSDRKRSH